LYNPRQFPNVENRVEKEIHMTRLSLVSAFLIVASLGVVGCQDNFNKKASDEPKNQELQTKLAGMQGLQEENAQLKAANQDLQSQLDARNAQIVQLQQQRSSAKPAAEPKKNNSVPEGWQETTNGAKITISHDILFAPGKADFTPAGKAKLKEVAAAIKSHYPNALLRVCGFTDNDPIVKTKKLWDDNLDLSANRAMMVTRELIRLGVAADRIETIAMGSTHPIAPNADKAGKAKNRRVDIVAINK
jgi:flagellar motor protein MotB